MEQSFILSPLLRHLQSKWESWCGNREMELSIRKHLTQNGYFGGAAKFQSVRLVAIQRPGWLQVYRFEVTARVDPEQGNASSSQEPSLFEEPSSFEEAGPSEEAGPVVHELLGLVREDARKNISDVRVFLDEQQRQELFQRWSQDLICLRGAKGLLSS